MISAIVRMGDKDKVRHTQIAFVPVSFQAHAFLTIIHPLDFSDFSLGDVLDDILGLVTGIGQGLWCLDFFNFGIIRHGERNLGHRSRCSAHRRECRACGNDSEEEGDGEGTHCWLVVRDEVSGRADMFAKSKLKSSVMQISKSNFNFASWRQSSDSDACVRTFSPYEQICCSSLPIHADAC